LVDSIGDSTEIAIQKMIEGCQRIIRVSNNNNNDSQQEEEVRINPAMKRHFELEIETLQNESKDAEKDNEVSLECYRTSLPSAT
jgi:hypothetical protein